MELEGDFVGESCIRAYTIEATMSGSENMEFMTQQLRDLDDAERLGVSLGDKSTDTKSDKSPSHKVPNPWERTSKPYGQKGDGSKGY